MLEEKYFVCAMEIEDSSERFELNRSFRPIIKFFGSKRLPKNGLTRNGANII